ncbi:hypothetical protein FOZ62_022662 [Perkinsus olseni]|uniref:Uncharacterized protein n=2 Tax=Perkinsus olseni TaxID=32597 RepID=A0A7J6UAP5_PEROL|nr:hypothetical protein FOZ62_022662 [Perkinsus olseni]
MPTLPDGDPSWDQNSKTSNTSSSVPTAPAPHSLPGDTSTKAGSASSEREGDLEREVDPRVADLDNCRHWTIGEPRPMCEAAIRKVCSERGQYETPHLNDCLYLQMCGFTSIGGLQPYSGIHSLFLMSNQLHRIEGLECLSRLRMLYLNNNGLTQIEGLQECKNLEYLNLSNNRIRTVRNLEELTSLKTLIVANNHISDFDSDLGRGLSKIPWLLSLDITYNLLEASGEGSESGAELIKFLQSCCPQLNDFYAHGNPYVRQMRHYRRRVIAALPTLTYIDKSPVTREERAGAEAFVKGGTDAENRARRAYLVEKQRAMAQLVTGLRQIQRQRREELNLPEPDLHEAVDGCDDGDDEGTSQDDHQWLGPQGDAIFQQEPSELHFDPPPRVDDKGGGEDVVNDDCEVSRECVASGEAEKGGAAGIEDVPEVMEAVKDGLKTEMRDFLRSLREQSSVS